MRHSPNLALHLAHEGSEAERPHGQVLRPPLVGAPLVSSADERLHDERDGQARRDQPQQPRERPRRAPRAFPPWFEIAHVEGTSGAAEAVRPAACPTSGVRELGAPEPLADLGVTEVEPPQVPVPLYGTHRLLRQPQALRDRAGGGPLHDQWATGRSCVCNQARRTRRRRRRLATTWGNGSGACQRRSSSRRRARESGSGTSDHSFRPQ